MILVNWYSWYSYYSSYPIRHMELRLRKVYFPSILCECEYKYLPYSLSGLHTMEGWTFHPMILILFICVFVELYSSNFKLIVMLWKPFHKCFVRVRRSWDPKASMINAFATFLLLLFSKLLYVSCFSHQRMDITISNGASYRFYIMLSFTIL